MGMKLITDNRKARFNYEIIEVLEAGMVLRGSEVKSLREGRANLKDGYVVFKGDGAFLHSIHISPYPNGGYANHEPERIRKLLLHKKEIDRWRGKIREKGYSAVPLKLYFKSGKAKCEVALAKGRKLHDKRDVMRKKTMDREARAAMKTNWGS